jgi:hypothetical protein
MFKKILYIIFTLIFISLAFVAVKIVNNLAKEKVIKETPVKKQETEIKEENPILEDDDELNITEELTCSTTEENEYLTTNNYITLYFHDKLLKYSNITMELLPKTSETFETSVETLSMFADYLYMNGYSVKETNEENYYKLEIIMTYGKTSSNTELNLDDEFEIAKQKTINSGYKC